jgi:hypothetical protein
METDTWQLIAEGSQKLASVPSGGSGGGAAPAAGGAAAGGAAAEAAPAEEKEEGMLKYVKDYWMFANPLHREGGVRRGYGFRSFRLSNQITSPVILALGILKENGLGFWEGLCGICLSHAYIGSKGQDFTSLLMMRCRYA